MKSTGQGVLGSPMCVVLCVTKGPTFSGAGRGRFWQHFCFPVLSAKEICLSFSVLGMGQERELQMQRLLELFDAHLGARLLQMLVMLMWLGYHVFAGS